MDLDRALGKLPEWREINKPLTAAAYGRYDAVLQVVGDDGDAPYADLFAAISRRRRAVADVPPVITLPGGTAVCRLRWRKDEDAFCRLQRMRKALSPLLALSPAKLALDVRGATASGGAAADALYAALVGAAQLPHSAATSPRLTLAAAEQPAPAVAIAAEANTTARALTRLPPNELTPAVFVRIARQLAKRHGLEMTTYTAARLRQLGAGAMLAVGRGGTPPVLVRLRYHPRAARRLVLVGKGVCFDTGGINVKPARYMRGMGKDMAGAAVALAALVGAAQLRGTVGVDAWLALAENNIGPTAYRPDEVITAHNGKRVEIVHTDAEGRLLLADALSLASRAAPAGRESTTLVSLATLTGTMHVALGERMSGFFCADADWRGRALAAAAESGERLCWFPAPDDYRAALKSETADIKQCSEEGDADHILAALFLREFVDGDLPWLHVDLSAATCKGGLGAVPGEITGFGAAWLLALLRGWT